MSPRLIRVVGDGGAAAAAARSAASSSAGTASVAAAAAAAASTSASSGASGGATAAASAAAAAPAVADNAGARMGDKNNSADGASEFESLPVAAAAAAAAAQLRAGAVVAVATDTIYGVACDASSAAAIAALYAVKARDAAKPVAICVGRLSDVGAVAKVTLPPAALARLLPGPLTLAFERRDAPSVDDVATGDAVAVVEKEVDQEDGVATAARLSPALNPGAALVGVRLIGSGAACSSSSDSAEGEEDEEKLPFLTRVAREFGGPIALTSANKSGAPSTRRVEDFKELWPSLGAVFDGGDLPTTEGSTVVDLSRVADPEPVYRIIRQGQGYDHLVSVLHELGAKEAGANGA